MNKNIKQYKPLFEGILKLKTVEECELFFDDLCTIKELQSIAQRFEVAQMLYDENTYIDVGEKKGASTATISRVNRCLVYGDGGYSIVLNRLKKDNKKENNTNATGTN